MSLKGFHILFICLSILLAAGCAVWAFANGIPPVVGLSACAIAAALFVYGIYFIRKSRKLIV